VYIYLKGKGAASPIDGAKVSIMDVGTGSFLTILDVNQTFVTTKRGVASVKVRVKPRLGYALMLSYTDADKEFQTTVPMDIRGDIQENIEFDPEKWTVKGTKLEPVRSPQLVPIAEGQANLPPWMKFAYDQKGVSEIHGTENNPNILKYVRSIGDSKIPLNDE